MRLDSGRNFVAREEKENTEEESLGFGKKEHPCSSEMLKSKYTVQLR